MRFPQQFVQQVAYPSGALAISGAAPQTVVGNQFDSGLVGRELGAVVVASITTLNLTVAAEWQVLEGSTWVAVQSPTTATVLQTGTGTLVTGSYYVPAPPGVASANRWARLAVISGDVSGGGAGVDSVAISYDFRGPTNSMAS
jgi:hypothetical protein